MNVYVIKQLLLAAVCLLRIDLSTCVIPVILESPMTQVVPSTQNEAQFTCHARASAAFWLINGGSLFHGTPYCVLHLYDDVHDFGAVEVTRRIGIRTQRCNGTKVECIATGDSDNNARSSPGYLYVVYPPDPPSPTFVTLNATALRVSWTMPFSWDGFPVLTYELNIYNMTSSSLIDTIIYNVSDSNVSFSEYVLTVSSVLSECHTISVEVTATNSVGKSSPGMATGGFPIALDNFLRPLTVQVTFTIDLLPIVNVTFKPPHVCQFQRASYLVNVVHLETMTSVSHFRRIGAYDGDSEIPTISESYETGFEQEKQYEAVVVIESVTGSVRAVSQFNTSINITPKDIPQLAILNSTAIGVRWNRSSSFQPNVDISYVLVIRNETDQFRLEEEIFNVSADFINYPLFYVYSIDSFDVRGCHNISFTIFSHSSGGENERPGSAVIGFPVDPSNFSASLHADVTFTVSLEPKVKVVFEYPQICWYQIGTYNIQILSAVGTEVMSTGPRQYRSTDNPQISEDIQSAGLSKDQVYRAVVTAESFGESAQAETEFSTALVLPTVTDDHVSTGVHTSPPVSAGVHTSPPDIEMIVGITLGCCAGVALILIVCIICIICHLRRRKIKVERLRRPPLPQVPNPLYETGGPIYEEIPAEKKFNSLAKPQPIAPCAPCSEYVMIEGKKNGNVDHYDQLCASEKDFDDIKKPLDRMSAKSLGFSSVDFPPFTAGEDPYTLMNPAGAASSMDQEVTCQSLSRSATAGSRTPMRPSLSLPLVSMRVDRQESEPSDTPEERYVRRSLLL